MATLEITSPRAGSSANHRTKRAYTGLTYNIRASAVGGVFPYTWSLSNAPSGMSIDATTGEITWTNPSASASNITVTVEDSIGATDSETWSITVGTSGFVFVDAVNGNDTTGDGSLANPWQTLAKVHTTTLATDIVYFRKGTYTTSGITINGSGNQQYAEFRTNGSTPHQSVIWLAYPGETWRENPADCVKIDFGFSGPTDTDFSSTANAVPYIRFRSNYAYIDGFETDNSWRKGFEWFQNVGNEDAPTFRNLYMHDHGPGLNSENASMIMITTNVNPGSYLIIQDNEFDTIYGGTGNCALKLYALISPLIEDNRFTNTGLSTEAVVAVKSDVRNYTIRGNYVDASRKAVGGNMHHSTTTGEICYNILRAPDGGSDEYALELNQDSMSGPVAIYRNTIRGRVYPLRLDTDDGPFTFTENIIINSDATATPFNGIRWAFMGNAMDNWTNPNGDGFGDESRIIMVDNLIGIEADGIVDSDSLLQGEYRTLWLGLRGHELSGSGGGGVSGSSVLGPVFLL